MALSTLPSQLIPCCPATTTRHCALPITVLRLRLRLVKGSGSLVSFASSSQNQPPLPFNSEQAVLDTVAEFVDVSENLLPAVRTFENDLARLTVVGAVDFQQALTAAAADGGEAADEHISSGMDAMVVETVFPGSGGDHSTVSTRLFLPARRVKEKAMKLKKSMVKDMLQGTTSKNILAMTFRQVVLQQLWSLELVFFSPGTERNMNNLENPREVPVMLTLTTADEHILSEIGEVICLAALESTKSHFLHDSTTQKFNGFFGWRGKHKMISSKDSSASVYNFLENEMLVNTRALLEKFDLECGKKKFKTTNLKNIWWTPALRKLERIGGPQFCTWVSESIPSYMLAIDAKQFSDLKLEGWTESDSNRWEAALTHSQMISLADILDMYYEDVFTLPNKRLSCHAAAKLASVSSDKGNSLLKVFTKALVAGVFLVAIGVMKKLYLPQLHIRNNYTHRNSLSTLSETTSVPLRSVESSLMGSCYVRIVSRIKDYFGWPGEVWTNSGVCVWAGTLPTFLRTTVDAHINTLDVSSSANPFRANDEDMRSLELIASYQVVVSTDGDIVGFQPTNRVAVNNWAGNPLTQELYRGKKLSPGLLEPGLKIRHPNGGVVVLELLMSVDPNSYFAMIRPVDTRAKS